MRGVYGNARRARALSPVAETSPQSVVVAGDDFWTGPTPVGADFQRLHHQMHSGPHHAATRPAGPGAWWAPTPWWRSLLVDPVQALLPLAGAGLGAYHGYKRTKSVGWALGYSAAGSLFPLVTGGIALAQGFGKPKGSR